MVPERCALALLACLALASSGGLRAAEPDTFACVLVVDGLKGDVTKRYAEQGLMPNYKKLFLDEGIWVDKATSVFPSITGAAMPSVVTGAYPGRHGIPSLYFFERPERKYYVLYTINGARQFNRFLDKERTRTIFEHFPGAHDTYSVGLQVYRGADAASSIAFNVKYQPQMLRAKAAELWGQLRHALGGAGMPRVVVYYNGWFDHVEHATGPEGEALKEHYAAIDAQLGEAVATYRRHGLLDRTYFVVASDHGQQPFDKRVSVWDYIKSTYKLKITEYDWIKIMPGAPVDWDVRNPEDFDDYAMVVTAGEAHALLYFARPGATPGKFDWSARPTFAELRNYRLPDGRTVDPFEDARNQAAVDFCTGKDREANRVHVFGKGKAESTIERRDGAAGPEFRYTVAPDAVDPLGFAGDPAFAGLVNQGYRSDREWQEAEADSGYPDAVAQLYQAFDSERAPDIFINGAKGFYLCGLEWGTDISRHGAINADESHCTLAFHGPSLKPQRVHTARSVDMVPSVLACLKVPFDQSLMDGRPLRAILDDLDPGRAGDQVSSALTAYLDAARAAAAAEAEATAEGGQGGEGVASMAGVVAARRRADDLLSGAEARGRSLLESLVASGQTDGAAVRAFRNAVEACSTTDRALLAPFVKELSRALALTPVASEVRSLL